MDSNAPPPLSWRGTLWPAPIPSSDEIEEAEVSLLSPVPPLPATPPSTDNGGGEGEGVYLAAGSRAPPIIAPEVVADEAAPPTAASSRLALLLDAGLEGGLGPDDEAPSTSSESTSATAAAAAAASLPVDPEKALCPPATRDAARLGCGWSCDAPTPDRREEEVSLCMDSLRR